MDPIPAGPIGLALERLTPFAIYCTIVGALCAIGFVVT
jgi:hypothetical protein